MRSLSKVPISEIMDHFVSTWKFDEGISCKKYEYHVDVIKNVIVFDMELEDKNQQMEVQINTDHA